MARILEGRRGRERGFTDSLRKVGKGRLTDSPSVCNRGVTHSLRLAWRGKSQLLFPSHLPDLELGDIEQRVNGSPACVPGAHSSCLLSWA